ncbi:MAG: hypothetical protein ACJAQ4_000643 [Cryomorphaceae bacterium]
MKKEFGHIALFVSMVTLLVSGGFLTYSQVQNDMDSQLLSQRSIETTDEIHESALDTLRFLVDPSYEFCEFACEEDENSSCEKLSKTIVSVNQKGFSKTNLNSPELARLPANASINLMFETYSVSRRTDSCSTTYYVTVESFDTSLENIQNEIDSDISTFNTLSPDELYEAMRSGESLEWVKKFCADPRPY